MKALFRMVLLLPPLLLAASANVSNAESPPKEILMNATKLTCTFTSQKNTRWGPNRPITEDGQIPDEVIIFDSIDHQTKKARIPLGHIYSWTAKNHPVKFRTFDHSLTFFELAENGEFDPVITTILDDYLPNSTQFIVVRSAHITSAFKKGLAIQKFGTCLAGD